MMRTGMMVFGPVTELEGRPVDLDAFLASLQAWGLQSLDIFPDFMGERSAQEVRAALDRCGLICDCYYVGADLCAPGAQAREVAEAAFARGIEAATLLGAPILFTHGTQHTYAGEEMFARYAAGLGEMLALFESTGITLVVENAGTLMHRVEDMLRLMQLLGPAGLRLCLDTGNFYLWEQDEVAATRLAREWTVHFHVKDYVDRHWVGPGQPGATDVNLGTGNVRHAEVLEILRETGYAGTLSCEPFSTQSMRPGVTTLASWLA